MTYAIKAEDVALLREAFPGSGLQATCAPCGRKRNPGGALCRRCWFELPQEMRRDYMTWDLPTRARFILRLKEAK